MSEIHNLKFSVAYGSTLVKSKKTDELRKYIKQFFFKYLTQIFFFDGNSFRLYELEQAQKLIPKDWEVTMSTSISNEHTTIKETKTSVKEIKTIKPIIIKETISFKNYLKDSDFMENEYIPTIDFNKDRIFKKKIILGGQKINSNFLNMAKPVNQKVSTIKSKRTEKTLLELILVYDHINEVL